MTTQWSQAALTVLASMGLGVYLTAAVYYIRGKGGEIRPPLLFFAAGLLFFALITATLSLGNPSKIVNILGHPQSGFSMAMLGTLALAIICLYLTRLANTKDAGMQKTIIIILGAAVALIICYGISMIHMKPSRPALYTWSVPLYLVAFAASSGIFGYNAVLSFLKSEKANSLRIGKYVALFLQAIAIIGFVLNLNSIGLADKSINIELLLKGELSLYFYILVVIIGLMLPAVFEFVSLRAQRGNKIFALLALAAVTVGGAGFSIILSASAGYIRKLIWP